MGTGIANLCDEPLLRPGSPCIILVKKNRWVWLGRILSAARNENALIVTAVIDRGRLEQSKDGCEFIEILNHPDNGKTPKINYEVFPDTESFRKLLWRLVSAENVLNKLLLKIFGRKKK